MQPKLRNVLIKKWHLQRPRRLLLLLPTRQPTPDPFLRKFLSPDPFLRKFLSPDPFLRKFLSPDPGPEKTRSSSCRSRLRHSGSVVDSGSMVTSGFLATVALIVVRQGNNRETRSLRQCSDQDSQREHNDMVMNTFTQQVPLRIALNFFASRCQLLCCAAQLSTVKD